jgi:hypothetical protein
MRIMATVVAIAGGTEISASPVQGEPPEFSGLLVKRVDGRRSEAYVYAKPDRIRIDY